DNLLVVLGIKNKLKALSFLKKIEKQEKQYLEKIDYQGVTIFENTNLKKKIPYAALVDNKLIISEDYQSIEQAIDAYQNKDSLANLDNAQQIFSQQTDIKNPLAKIYFTNYAGLIETFAPPEALWGINIMLLKDQKPMVMAIGTKEKALHFQSIIDFNFQSKALDDKSRKNKLLDDFPENTIALISSQKINHIWSSTSQNAGISSYLQQLIWILTSNPYLDVDQDIFSWMDGEFALGIIPTNTAIIPELGTGIGAAIALETNDPATAKASLDKIENAIQQNVQITPSQKTSVGKTITEWQMPNEPFTFAYSWIDDDSLFFTVGDSVMDTIGNKSIASINESSKFEEIAEELPNNNLSSLYLNMSSITEIINRLPLEAKSTISPETMELLNSMEGLGATVSVSDKSKSQFDLLVQFKTF
ncbi:MAG: DUF3352 domain-containing protein, partial [Waterburya sp.]